MAVGAAAGLLAGLLESLLPPRWQSRLPSATTMGLAFVIPASMSITMFLGALLAWEQSLVRPDDLSQVKRAFDLNGWVGILYLVTTAAAIYW